MNKSTTSKYRSINNYNNLFFDEIIKDIYKRNFVIKIISRQMLELEIIDLQLKND